MDLLLNDELAPITSDIGFLECGLEVAASRFEHWRSDLVARKKSSRAFTSRAVTGTLREALLELPPLTDKVPERFLFVPTESSWVAYFDNSLHGPDVAANVGFLSEAIGCRALRIAAVPDGSGRYGAKIFEVYGPEGDELGYIRSVALINDGGELVFDEFGSPFEFERTEQYEVERLEGRLSFESLRDYALAMGVRVFDADFYLPGGTSAVLFESEGKSAWGAKSFSLSEARATWGQLSLGPTRFGDHG